MSLTITPHAESGADDRWPFLRDVLVFQGKLFLSNLRDIALMPATLIAALFDVFIKGDRHGAFFYRVLRWAAHSEEAIGVYSALGRVEAQRVEVNPNFTVDGLIARLEGVLVRECEKGGTAANVKAAMDRAFDQIHAETSGGADRARTLLESARGKLQGKLGQGEGVLVRRTEERHEGSPVTPDQE